MDFANRVERSPSIPGVGEKPEEAEFENASSQNPREVDLAEDRKWEQRTMYFFYTLQI